jgi:hypothetical protein
MLLSFICGEGISQAEMLVFLFGAAREFEKSAKRVSHDLKKQEKEPVYQLVISKTLRKIIMTEG